MVKKLPFLLGASLKIADLPGQLPWLLEGPRDLEIWDPSTAEILDGDLKSQARLVKSLLDGFNGRLGIHGPWDALPLICRDARIRDLVVMRLQQALEFAMDIGASQMVLHSPFEFYGSPTLAHTPAHGLIAEIELVHRVLDPILSLAQSARCELVLEVCYDTAVTPLIKLIESFHSDWVRLSLDTGHACIMQTRGGPSPEHWVQTSGPLLTHLHLEDTDGLLDRHWAPGEGLVDWEVLFGAVSQLDHKPRLILEIEAGKIRSAVDWLAERGFAV